MVVKANPKRETKWSGKKLVLFWLVLIVAIIGAICFLYNSNHEVVQEHPVEEIPASLEITEEDLQEFAWPQGTPEQYISGYFVGYDIGKYDGYCDGYEAGYERGYDASCDGYGDYEKGYLKGYDEGYWDGYEAGDYDKACDFPYNPSS